MSEQVPLRLVNNPYPGVNAHLHSHWGAHGGWSEFHASYLSDETLPARDVETSNAHIAHVTRDRPPEAPVRAAVTSSK